MLRQELRDQRACAQIAVVWGRRNREEVSPRWGSNSDAEFGNLFKDSVLVVVDPVGAIQKVLNIFKNVSYNIDSTID